MATAGELAGRQAFKGFSIILRLLLSPPLSLVDSDDATICTTSLLSSSSPSGGGVPYTKEAVGTPPPSPSVSSGLSGAG